MTDFLLSPSLVPNECEWSLVDFSGVQQSPLSGAVRTVSRGQRWQVRLRWHDVVGDDRNYLSSLMAALRGKSNRCLISDASYDQMGSFPGVELFTNPYFTNGLTGYAKSGAFTNVAYNRRCRMDITGASSASMTQDANVQAFTPYALRGFHIDGVGTAGASGNVRFSDGVTTVNLITTSRGMLTIAGVAGASGSATQVVARLTSGQVPGDVLFVDMASLRQCALLDANPNALTQSDDISNAAWSKVRSSVGSAITAPDGSVTAHQLIEDSTASQSHYVQQNFSCSSAVADIALCVTVKANTRSWIALQMIENTGGTFSHIYFDLTNGVLGSVNTGANFANVRGVMVPLDGGWYRCYVIAQKANAATSMTARLFMASGNNLATYNGDGVSSLYVWRHGAAQTGSGGPTLYGTPWIPSQTTSSALAAGVSPAGSSCYLRGLPGSINGLLRAGDRCEINGEFKAATADLNTDAAGCGALFFEPSLRSAKADGDPVHLGQPFMKGILMDGAVQPSRPGLQLFSDFEFTFIEAN